LADAGECACLQRDLTTLRAELKVTEELLAERQRLLDAVPECPSHGPCVPHAIKWIETAKALRAGIATLNQWCEERRNAPDITTLGMIQAKLAALLEGGQ